jgi:hypothetical protein
MNMQGQNSWQALLEAGLVSGPMPKCQSLESPWYVRLMLGMAGWIAALFLLGFVAAGLSWIIDTDIASISTGIIMMIAAWLMLLRIGHNDFAVQFALALSFAGQALFANGLFDQLYAGRGDTANLLVMALTQLVLAVVMPNAIHRPGKLDLAQRVQVAAAWQHHQAAGLRTDTGPVGYRDSDIVCGTLATEPA